MNKLKTALATAVLMLWWSGAAAQNDPRVGEPYVLHAYCHGDEKQAFAEMVDAVRVGSDQAYIEIVTQPEVRCVEGRLFGFPPLRATFVKELARFTQVTSGMCMSVALFHDAVGTEVLSWIGCDDGPPTDQGT